MFLSWDPDDQDKTLIYLMRESGRCSGCGTFIDEWIDPNEGKPLDPPPYVPEALRCMGCLTLSELREESGSEEGVYMRFVRNE